MTAECAIPRFPSSGDFVDFMNYFLLPNTPCIFDKCLTSSWKSRELWQIDGHPSFNYLAQEFGDAEVPVADCNEMKYSAHPKMTQKFWEYLDYWKSVIKEEEKQRVGNPQLLYLKDWHFVKSFPAYGAYTVPSFFSSDWINEAWQQHTDVQDDYQFVYMGPAGSWTPFHADVFRSYSWSANVCGIKEWLLYPPGEEEFLRDKLGNLPPDITSKELKDRTHYPNAHRAGPPLRVVQGPGEVIFVPSGWYHQVKNLVRLADEEDTISINHNWTNAFGVHRVWTHLKAELALVESEIADCQEMEGWDAQCQLVLKASAGMDYTDLHRFLTLIAEPRLRQVEQLAAHLRASQAGIAAMDVREVSDNLLHVLELCRHKLGSSQSPEATILKEDVLKRQADALPHNLLSAVLQLASQLGGSQGDRESILLAAVVFRSYELHQISSVLNELTGSLQALDKDTVTRDYGSELLQALTGD